ncbi:beta-aspartyl-peptidase [Thermosediminibacter litoriperuensis]|uniref:Isoaspartyl dipeptidase n=1 Tax=Thermosediminibacter litoriperuensis TaxID=291989 RepID=A0A5S5AY71_9FIRM|nr:beta-aspartyl-peptidase [Thermosediminibacter litoriperuensis]TYP58824.1 beta-aspartyl-dipeptidase (metallo-type) [Thermosediminibacter litoriperuensis]
MIHIKDAHVFAPEDMGNCDVLIEAGKIIYVGKSCEVSGPFQVEVVHLEGANLCPGFIDQHVHITGGGGEGGPETSTPEIRLSDLTRNGITTVIGCLGTDGITRSMARLYNKARALEIEGISTYIFTGAYQFPLPTLTGSIQTDLIFIDKVVGVGEVAISDHRSSHASAAELARLAGEARVAAMIGKKGGKLHLHVGDGARGLKALFRIAASTDVPLSQFQPTHLNRCRRLMEESIEFAMAGGYCDYTAGEDILEDDEVTAARAIYEALKAGAPAQNLTISSDGNGSMPVFDSCKRLVGMGIGDVSALLKSLKAMVFKYDIPFETALATVTKNPAGIHRLEGKGEIREGFDADLVVMDENLEIRSVIAKGRWMVRDGKVQVFGTFEKSMCGK